MEGDWHGMEEGGHGIVQGDCLFGLRALLRDWCPPVHRHGVTQTPTSLSVVRILSFFFEQLLTGSGKHTGDNLSQGEERDRTENKR